MIARLQNKISFGVVAAMLALCVAAAVYTGFPYMAYLPVAGIGLLLAFQYPRLLFYALVAAIPWSMEYQVTGALSTDVPDEPLMWASTFITIALMVYKGKGVFKMLPLHPLMLVLLVQLGWTVVSVVFSTVPLLSVKFIVAKTWFVLPYVLLPVLLQFRQQQIKTTGMILSASMMLATLVALVKHAANGFTFASVNESLAPFFRNHVNYSALLVCVVPVVFILTSNTANKKPKGFLMCCLVILLAALYLSYSRGAWVALLVGVAAYGLVKRSALLKGFLVALAICTISFLWLRYQNNYLRFAHDYQTTIFHTNFEEHLVATYQLKDVSTAERFYRWIAGVRMVQYNPVTGYGPNTFYYNYKGYTIPAFKTWVSNNPEHSTVHNYFLLATIEQGLPGLLFLLLLLGFMFYTVQKIYNTAQQEFWKQTALCIGIILSMICTLNFLSDLIETDKIGSLFYLCIGFLIIADHQSRRNPVSRLE